MNKIFSGDHSKDMWEMIDSLRKTSPELWELFYTLGCRLQELESLVRRQESFSKKR